MESLKELVNKIEFTKINANRRYWVVRAGVNSIYYENFKLGKYVAIGWDSLLNIKDIKNSSIDELKARIKQEYDEVRPGSSANKILTFINEMNIGDIVITPSAGKENIMFSEIESDIFIYNDDTEFKKRRKVKLLKELSKQEVDPKLILALYPPHSIFTIDKQIENLIDSHINNFYIKDETACISFNINKEENLSALNLASFQYNLIKSIELYNEITGENLSTEDLVLKIRAQSKGKISFISKTIAVIGVIGVIGVVFCGGEFEIESDIKGKTKVKLKTPGLADKYIEFQKNKNENHLKLIELTNNIKEEKEKLEIEVPKIELKEINLTEDKF